MPFVPASGDVAKVKPDKTGLIAIRVDLQSVGIPVANGVQPAQGNLRETILVEGATVGEVAAAIRKALFSE